MTSITAYHPPLFAYDFAKEFLKIGNSPRTLVYKPLEPDFGTMLTVNMKNNLFVHSGVEIGVFDHVSYFVHFLLGLLFMSQERTTIRNELGIQNVFYLYERQQLRIFVLSELNGQKTLLMKMVNFNEDLRGLLHFWQEDDLKTIFSIMYEMNETPDNYHIESQWLDMIVENNISPAHEEVLSPLISFTMDIHDGGIFQDRIKREAMAMKRKFRKYFRRVQPKTNYASLKSLFTAMASMDQDEASNGFEEFAEITGKIFKGQFQGTTPISRDFSSMTSTSQTGFMHGILTGLQNVFSFHATVEQIFTKNPGFRINVLWKPYKTWSKMITGRPMQLYFYPALEKLVIKHGEVIPTELMGKGERAFVDSVKSEVLFIYMNLNAKGKTCIIQHVKNIPTALDLLNDVKTMAAVTLKDKIVLKLDALKKTLNNEYNYILKSHLPCTKNEKLNYLSRYIHGYLAAAEVSKASGAVYKLKHLNPSDLERKYLTSFLLKTDADTTDLVINIYEKKFMDDKLHTLFGDLKKKHVYPVTGDNVKHTVVVDYFLYFSTPNKPEYKSHIMTKEQAYMKSHNPDQISDFYKQEIRNINLQDLFSNFDPSKDMRDNKPVLSTIKAYFEEHFSYIGSKFELKAIIDGLLYKTNIQDNVINVRKDVLQVAFLENENSPDVKICLFNLAFGDPESTIHDLDEVRHLMEEGPFRGYENVKAINIASTKVKKTGPAKPMVLENRLLSIFHMCSRPRIKRNAICSSEEVKPVLDTFGKSENALISMKRQKYLTTLGRVASGVMFGLMAKDLIRDIVHGDITGIAINTGFLFSNYLFHHLAGKLVTKSSILAKDGKVALSNILKVGSSFLRHSASFAFVGFDLYQSVQAYKMGQSGAMVNIAADSTYLALDLAETAIEISEAFGFIEGVSAVTGPIGWAAGAALLVGADIYRSVKKVDDINHVIHLTRMERLAEGFRAFFGMDPEHHVAELLKQKTILQSAVQKISDFLKSHDTIGKFIFPINLEDSGNIIVDLLDRHSLKMGRSVPSVPSSTSYFCLPKLDHVDDSLEEITTFTCKNAVGLNRLSSSSNYMTYILLASGYGTIKAAENDSHIYDIVGPGIKKIFGSRNGDTIILRNENSCGVAFIGQSGNNILDVSNIDISSQIVLNERTLVIHEKVCMKYTGIGTVIGRRNHSDMIVAWRGLNHIESHGGNVNESDQIVIPRAYKSNETMTIILSGGFTNITNDAIIGNFTYVIMDLHDSNYLNINNEFTDNHIELSYNSFSISWLNMETISGYATVDLKFSESYLKINLPIDSFCLHFQDGANLLMKRGRIVLDVTTPHSISDGVSTYSKLAMKTNISVVIHSLLDSKTVTLNHNALNEDNHAIDIVYVLPKHSHLLSMSPEVIYIFEENSQRNVTIVVNAKQKIIIDISALNKNASLSSEMKAVDVILKFLSLDSNSSTEQNRQIILEGAMVNESYSNVVVKDSSIKVFQQMRNSIILISEPLVFSRDESLIVISPFDGIENGTQIFFENKTAIIEYYNMNNTDLMLTNVRISERIQEKEFTLILKDFYKNKIMQTLTLNFVNRVIDFNAPINLQRAMRAKDVELLFKKLAEEIAMQTYLF